MDRILGIHFRPPLAIARVGGSDTPLECFVWAYDRTTYGAHRTVIRPSLTFEVLDDGSVRPYIPKTIQFRDGDHLRPVAPFFELWASVQAGTTGEIEERQVTLRLLEQLGASTDNVDYTITVGNRKAQRRTGSATCAYLARATTSASDWQPKTLLAFSPHNADEVPLVSSDRPVPLGRFQAIRPVAGPILFGERSFRVARAFHARSRAGLWAAAGRGVAGFPAATGRSPASRDLGREAARNRPAGEPHS